MPALNYDARFAPLVESGVKRHTIRPRRRDRRDPQPGQMLYHFTGMRTRECRRLREDPCTRVEPVTIDRGPTVPHVWRSRQYLPLDAIEDLAKADGFADADEMVEYFLRLYGLPFEGLLIHW